MRGLLLDTHALVWLAEGQVLSPLTMAAIKSAALDDGIYVSPISAWEIGILVTRKRVLTLKPDAESWFANFMAQTYVKPAPFDWQIAIGAAYLPEPFHPDPADRLLVATARFMGIPLVTRDGKILDYAKAGHVEVLAC